MRGDCVSNARSGTVIALALLFAGAAGAQALNANNNATSGTAASSPLEVRATIETAPVQRGGDAADDPAIWVHPKDPSKSVIVGTNKQAGIHVYDLTGKELQFLPDGRMNNVDLRDGFPLGGREVTLVTAGNRAGNYIAVYALDHETRLLKDVAARKIETAMAYGSCMYRSAKTGKFYYFLANKNGDVEQWELFDNGSGKVDAKRVRGFKLGSQLEGCAADDELGLLYVGEEAKGVWKFGAEPDASSSGAMIAEAGLGKPLTPDVEGIAIARTGAGTGYLIVSSQGSNSYVVLRREGNNEYVRSFRIVDGPVDGVQETDGLDVTTADLGGEFSSGLLVVHDGINEKAFQNFKLVPLKAVLPE